MNSEFQTVESSTPRSGLTVVRHDLAGFYKLVATNSKGQTRVVADWFANLILDVGLNRLGTGGIIDRISVGSGNSTPTAGQTSLDTLVATTTTTVGAAVESYDSVGNSYAFRRSTYRFATGVAAGNLTEVGAGWSGGLFSRALIKDGGGVPTTVTILSDETLDVIYELRVYVPADVVGTCVISGVTYNTVMRACKLNSSSYWGFGLLWAQGMATPNMSSTTNAFGVGALGTVLTDPGGTFLNNATSTAAVGSYVNNSYERVYRNTYGLSDGAVPFGAMTFLSRMGAYKASFDPPIPKDTTKILTIDWKISWARRP